MIKNLLHIFLKLAFFAFYTVSANTRQHILHIPTNCKSNATLMDLIVIPKLFQYSLHLMVCQYFRPAEILKIFDQIGF